MSDHASRQNSTTHRDVSRHNTSQKPANIDSEKAEVANEKSLTSHRSENASPEKNPNIVDWDGPDDPQNPKNWTTRSKWAAILVSWSWRAAFPTPELVMLIQSYR